MSKLYISRNNVNNFIPKFTLASLTTSLAYTNDNKWEDIIISELFYDYSIESIVNLICGFRSMNQREKIRFVLRNTPIHSQYADRVFYDAGTKHWVFNPIENSKKERLAFRKELLNLHP